MPEKVFYGGVVKVGRVYWPGSSLIITYHGPWYYAGDKVAEILRNMKMEWKPGNYRLYYHEFERASSRWMVYVDIFEMAGSAVEPKEAVLKIYMNRVKPSALHFSVLYHPKAVNMDAVNLEELLKSLLYRLPHIAEDVSRFSWASSLDKNYLIVYHDKELVTRIDVIFSHLKLPYKFVVAYHIDSPFLTVDMHVVAEGETYFNTLVEPILDEYWHLLESDGRCR